MRPSTVALALLILAGAIQAGSYASGYHGQGVLLERGFMAYDEYDNGARVVIALHGSPGGKDDFDEVAPLLDARVIAPDLYGFGDSEHAVADYGVAAAADDVVALMDALGVERATLLGYSWGGGVAIEAAARHPERVEALILLDGMGVQEGEPTGSYWGEHARYALAAPALLFYPGAFLGGFDWRYGFLRSFADSDQRPLRASLARLDLPVLVVHGTRDTVIPPWVAEEHARLARGELAWYDGGHGTLFRDGTGIAPPINGWLA